MRQHVGPDLLIRRRHLPHWQAGGRTYALTFRSSRRALPAPALDVAREEIWRGHGLRYDVVFGVLMPDHCHLILRPRALGDGQWCDLAVILKTLKGASAPQINRILGTVGAVWQKESFDRIIRDEREFDRIVKYLYENPFRARLVRDPADYPHFVTPPDGGPRPD